MPLTAGLMATTFCAREEVTMAGYADLVTPAASSGSVEGESRDRTKSRESRWVPRVNGIIVHSPALENENRKEKKKNRERSKIL